MDSWKRFDKTSLLDKKNHSSVNMEDITDVEYRHAKIVFKYYNNNNDLGDYHDLYVQSDMHYYLQMYLKTLEVCVLKYMNLILHIFVFSWISMAGLFKTSRRKIGIIN